MRLEDKYEITKEHILDGEIAEFEPVEKPKRERNPMYLASIVDMFVEDMFADMRDLLAQTLETRLSTDHIYKRDCFNRLMFIIRRNEMDNILDLYDYIQSGNDNMIHTVQMLTQTISYNTELVQLMFEGVHQKKRDNDPSDLEDIDVFEYDDSDEYETVDIDPSDLEDIDALEYDDSGEYETVDIDPSYLEVIDVLDTNTISDVADEGAFEYEDINESKTVDDHTKVGDDFTLAYVNLMAEMHVPKYSAMDVKQIRKAHKLTLSEFAQRINIQRTDTISKWEQGKSKPSKQSCENIRRFLNNILDIDSKQIIHTPNDIRYIRDTYGVTKSAIAKKTGVSVNTVRNWEYGKRTPSYGESEKLKQFIYELNTQ